MFTLLSERWCWNGYWWFCLLWFSCTWSKNHPIDSTVICTRWTQWFSRRCISTCSFVGWWNMNSIRIFILSIWGYTFIFRRWCWRWTRWRITCFFDRSSHFFIGICFRCFFVSYRSHWAIDHWRSSWHRTDHSGSCWILWQKWIFWQTFLKWNKSQ